MSLKDHPRFYHPDCIIGQTAQLDDEEARHAKVLRLQPGDIIYVVNGAGSLFEGEIEESKKRLKVILKEEIERSSPESGLTLAMAPTKNIARTELVIEKATEIGLKRFIPIACEHSERDRINVERLQKIAISAMKQSKGLWMPVIEELTPFNQVLNAEGKKWMAHCVDGEKRTLNEFAKDSREAIVLIGPEGDFSENEIESAAKAGCEMLDLGHKRLRTETAGLVICLTQLL